MTAIDKRKTIGTGAYAGQGGAAAAVGTLVAARYAGLVPDASPAEIGAVATISMWVVTVGVKAIRDLIHKRSSLPLVSLVALLLVFGCGASKITVYKLVNDEPVPVVEVDQHFAGKGCIAVDSAIDGSASVIVQQAGTSDWSLSRVVSFLGDTAGAVFGGTRISDEMAGPATGMQGCEGLFGNETEPPVEPSAPTPASSYLMTPMP